MRILQVRVSGPGLMKGSAAVFLIFCGWVGMGVDMGVGIAIAIGLCLRRASRCGHVFEGVPCGEDFV